MKNKPHINEDFRLAFRMVGKCFEAKYLGGFNLRKPKKIIFHTKQVLRTYRQDTSLNIFEKLSGIILIWRYVKMTNMPIREILKIERVVLRAFYFMLGDTSIEHKDQLTYLLDEEAGPRRSVMGSGSPLRHILELKLLELQVLGSADLSIQDRDDLESHWKTLYRDLSRKFRFRILNPT